MIKFKVIDYSCRLSIKFSPFDRFFYIIRKLLTYIINFMPITIHHKAGQLLLCDFSKGFREPEMGRDTWVKGDMVYTVAYHRLDLIYLSKNREGKRDYFTQRLGKEQMNEIYRCVLHGMGMSFMCQYL